MRRVARRPSQADQRKRHPGLRLVRRNATCNREMATKAAVETDGTTTVSTAMTEKMIVY